MSNVFTIIKLGFIACILAAFAFALVVNNPAFVDAMEAVANPVFNPIDPAHVTKHGEWVDVAKCGDIRAVYATLPTKNCPFTKFEFIKMLKDGRLCNMVILVDKAGKAGGKTAYAYDLDLTLDELDKIMRSKCATNITP